MSSARYNAIAAVRCGPDRLGIRRSGIYVHRLSSPEVQEVGHDEVQDETVATARQKLSPFSHTLFSDIHRISTRNNYTTVFSWPSVETFSTEGLI